jgi:hypothetical protein
MHKRIYIIYIKRELRLYFVHEHTQLVAGGTVNIPVPTSGLELGAPRARVPKLRLRLLAG